MVEFDVEKLVAVGRDLPQEAIEEISVVVEDSIRKAGWRGEFLVAPAPPPEFDLKVYVSRLYDKSGEDILPQRLSVGRAVKDSYPELVDYHEMDMGMGRCDEKRGIRELLELPYIIIRQGRHDGLRVYFTDYDLFMRLHGKFPEHFFKK